jgi:hypothetical protein
VEANGAGITAPQSVVSRLVPTGNQAPGILSRLSFTCLADLLGEPTPAHEDLVEGLLPLVGISVVAAKPKVGKSTFSRCLGLAVARGLPFLGRATVQGTVLYVTLEETRERVKRHFEALGGREEPLILHFGWPVEGALEVLEAAIGHYRARLVIIDPVFKLVRVRDLNDYAVVSEALAPLAAIARRQGCHLHLTHHMCKEERSGGDSILGSTAIFGAVDTALILHSRAQVRTIRSIQRYGDDLEEAVLDLDPATRWVSLGADPRRRRCEEALADILALLEGEDLPEAEIRAQLGGDQSLVAKALRLGVARKLIARSGSGRKGDPFRYALLNG